MRISLLGSTSLVPRIKKKKERKTIKPLKGKRLNISNSRPLRGHRDNTRTTPQTIDRRIGEQPISNERYILVRAHNSSQPNALDRPEERIQRIRVERSWRQVESAGPSDRGPSVVHATLRRRRGPGNRLPARGRDCFVQPPLQDLVHDLMSRSLVILEWKQTQPGPGLLFLHPPSKHRLRSRVSVFHRRSLVDRFF